jgi:hypothetical protein
MIERDHEEIAIGRQCELLGLSRASYYYESQRDDGYNQLLMNLIDEQFTKTPFYGVPRITESLRLKGYRVNQKRIRRLMHKMGLEAIYPKKNLSKAHPDHKKISVSSKRHGYRSSRSGLVHRYLCAAASGVRDEGMAPRSRFTGAGCKPP